MNDDECDTMYMGGKKIKKKKRSKSKNKDDDKSSKRKKSKSKEKNRSKSKEKKKKTKKKKLGRKQRDETIDKKFKNRDIVDNEEDVVDETCWGCCCS